MAIRAEPSSVCARDLDRRARCGSPVRRREGGVAVAVDRVGDDADGGLAVDLDGDRDPVAGMAVEVVGRAVDRVDHPANARGAGRRSRPPRRGSRRRGARCGCPRRSAARRPRRPRRPCRSPTTSSARPSAAGRAARARARPASACELLGKREQRAELGHPEPPARARPRARRERDRCSSRSAPRPGILGTARPGPRCSRRARRCRRRARSAGRASAPRASPSTPALAARNPEVVPAVGGPRRQSREDRPSRPR